MESYSIILVFFSAVCRAGWNYLIQNFKRPLVGMWLMTGIGLLVYLPVFLYTSRSLVLTAPLAWQAGIDPESCEKHYCCPG